MTTTVEKAISNLARIAKIRVTQVCEAVEHGRDPCPLQYDDQEHWSLRCLATRAAAD